MGKVEIEMELKGFALKVRADREDMPMVAKSLRAQMPGFLNPALGLGHIDSAVIDVPPPELGQHEKSLEAPTGKKRTRVRTARAASQNGESKSSPLIWNHDPSRWGIASQSWTAREKIVWLLQVISEACETDEVTAPVIVATFNTHFKQANPLEPKNMSRELGRLKQQYSFVCDKGGTSPTEWFLTESGKKEGARLVAEALARTQA